MDKRSLIIIVAIILIILGALFIYKKGCDDEECFNEALAKCSPAKLYSYRNNNLYLYKISRSLGDCKLYIKVEKMAIGSEPSLVRLLEGNSMKCRIPDDVTITLDEMENLLDYCHGSLKEGLYQIMLERLYALVVRDMSGIIDKAQEILKV